MPRVCYMCREADSETSNQEKTEHQDIIAPVLMGW